MCENQSFYRRNIYKSDAGLSLLGVIVAIGVLGIVAVILSQVLSNGIKGQKAIELRGERESIKRQLLASVSCEDSLTTNACDTPFVALKKRNKDGSLRTLVQSQGTKIGAFTLRAECNPSKDGLIIRATRLVNGASITTTNLSDFNADPLTGRKVTWTDNESLLLGAGIELCGSTSSRDIECFDGTRQRNILTGSTDIFEMRNITNCPVNGPCWGVGCKAPYTRMSCSISAWQTNSGQSTDGDVNFIPHGCWSDNEEWANNAKMNIVCCKLNR